MPGPRRWIAPLVLALCLAVSLSGAFDRLLGKAGLDRLSDYNRQYLDETFDRALGGFVTLSFIKSGLAVIEGSEAGVSMGVSVQVEVGDVVQAIYDYVDTAWSALLTGTAVLLGMQFLLRTVDLLDNWILAATLACFLASCLLLRLAPAMRGLNRVVRDAARFLVVLTAAGYLIVPLSVAGGSLLSRYISTPVAQAAQQELEEVGGKLAPAKEEQGQGLLERYRAYAGEMQDVGAFVAKETKRLATLVIKLIAGYAFDCLVFPFLVFNVLLVFIRSVTGYAFSLPRREPGPGPAPEPAPAAE